MGKDGGRKIVVGHMSVDKKKSGKRRKYPGRCANISARDKNMRKTNGDRQLRFEQKLKNRGLLKMNWVINRSS